VIVQKELRVGRDALSRQETFLKTAQVAEILGVTKRTVKNWLRAEWISEPRRNPLNGYREWTLGDIEAVRGLIQERNHSR